MSKVEKLRFMNISEGSLEECRNYILLARDLKYIDDGAYSALKNSSDQVGWFLNAYSKGIINNSGIKD